MWGQGLQLFGDCKAWIVQNEASDAFEVAICIMWAQSARTTLDYTILMMVVIEVVTVR